jgi:multidrug transporter EmrE-like cation transporter
MFRMNFRPDVQVLRPRSAITITVLTGGNLLFNIVANASFELSAASPAWRGFLAWQIAGNLAGFITVLTLTGLLRFVPLHVAYPVTGGLAVIGVQVVAAELIFHEQISSAQWLGTLLVVAGIALISGR